MQIKFFKKDNNFKKGKESFWLNINLYWKVSAGFILIVIFLSVFFGYYLFRQINKESILSISSGSGQVETVKKERIDKVLEYFSLKEQKSNQILNSSAPIVDPSL